MTTQKLTVIVICIISLFVSCNKQTNEIHEPTSLDPIQTSNKDEPIEIISLQYIPMSNTSRKVDKKYKEHWLDYINGRFNLDLRIPLVTPRFDGYNGIVQTEYLTNSLVTKGLVGFPSTASLKLYELVENGAILPFTSILSNSETWNNLPSEMRSIYEFDNEIWAIPSGYSTTFYVRTIDKQLLDNFGLSIPNTFEELENLFGFLTWNDPDGDGVDNSIGANANLPYVIDIFNNMNCFIQQVDNRIQVTSIAYDKNKNQFVDCMFNDDIKKPLRYIKGMLDDGVVQLNVSDDVKVMTQAYFTSYGITNDKLIWGYDGNNNNPMIINYDEYFIVAAVGMLDATKAINKFVDVFYSEPDAYLASLYGLPDEAYMFKNTVNLIKNDMKMYNMPVIIGYNPNIEEKLEYSEGTEINLKHIGYEQAVKLMQLDDAFILPASTYFAVKERIEYINVSFVEERQINGDELLSLFEYYYRQIMNGFMTIDEGIAAYRVRATELGVEDYLEELNNYPVE